MHPSILKEPVRNLYTLGSVEISDALERPDALKTDVDYEAQLVLFGPDAAIQVKDGRMLLFIDGVPADNPDFVAFVEADSDSVFAAAKKLRDSSSDTVIFTGKWHHVDYDQEPIFRPYVIHVTTAHGVTKTVASIEDIFYSDEDNRYFAAEYVDADDLAINPIEHFRRESERSIRRFVHIPFSSGYFSWGGILWHPKAQDGVPVYVPLADVITHRLKHPKTKKDLDPSFVAPFKLVDVALSRLKGVLRHAETGVTNLELASAYNSLSLAIATLALEEDRDQVWDFVRTLLGKWRFDEPTSCLAEKFERPQSNVLTLEEMARETTANGYWSIIRYEGHDREQPPQFETFLSSGYHSFKDAVLTGCDPQYIEGVKGACTFASDWIQYHGGVHRVLAFGPEAKLAW